MEKNLNFKILARRPMKVNERNIFSKKKVVLNRELRVYIYKKPNDSFYQIFFKNTVRYEGICKRWKSSKTIP
jgi:hypothetical protein